jgi:hypothetical protein
MVEKLCAPNANLRIGSLFTKLSEESRRVVIYVIELYVSISCPAEDLVLNNLLLTYLSGEDKY